VRKRESERDIKIERHRGHAGSALGHAILGALGVILTALPALSTMSVFGMINASSLRRIAICLEYKAST